ncbi:helix-turn-helix domain-containing protein [uncultured Hydrogenophaga sp.]|uniref:winged helix-turn-helix transcriptional regulator n=1 Tax=uncultured Hydrogenophaga sp. TaxID=199683 RepID=UPI00265F9345|nr:winged helix-turn-helix transcriptional regulator [uncultured Hydrogenophaga sp.]
MSKDPEAVSQLFDLLECRYAMRVLWALADGHAQTFRLLQDSVGGITPNTLNTRLKELRAAGLIEHDGQGYRLTAPGSDLARRLGEVRQFAGRWAQVRPGSPPRAGAAAPDHAHPD